MVIGVAGLLSFLLSALIVVLVLALFYWIAMLVCEWLEAPPRVVVIVKAILLVVALLWLIGFLAGFPPLRIHVG